jgi:hypothetical protein
MKLYTMKFTVASVILSNLRPNILSITQLSNILNPLKSSDFIYTARFHIVKLYILLIDFICV